MSRSEDPRGSGNQHSYAEHEVDLGEVRMNYVTAGDPEQPALLLIPAQIESWWGYEAAIGLLKDQYQVFAVDLRGQGRSTRTPGRYTLDNMGNDLVRFVDTVIGRPTLAAGNSSGGVLAAWLAAYAKAGQVRAALCEDPPFFASEVNPACGHSIRQSLGPMFALASKWLGDQWSIGDWAGMQGAGPKEVPVHVLMALVRMGIAQPPSPDGPGDAPQNFREYDPEWARSFWTGTATQSVDHQRMLSSVRVPLLITHHWRAIDPDSGALMGAVSDEQIARAKGLITAAGQPCEVIDLPEMTHSMHRDDPGRYASTVTQWTSRIVAGAAAPAHDEGPVGGELG